MAGTAHKFHVALQGIEPCIWRRILVPSVYSFWDLHVAIQDSMGWLDYHLHAFRVKNHSTGIVDEIGIPDDESSFEGVSCLAGWEVPIAAYFVQPSDVSEYVYDFGDDWVHTVKLEAVESLSIREAAPACLAGERACPPEDCGGVFGYDHVLEVVSNPDHPEHNEMLEWLGGLFDPEVFEPSTVTFDDPAKRWKIAFENDV